MHYGTVSIRLQSMASALASKASVPLATVLPIASRTAPLQLVRISWPSLHQRLILRSNERATQLRHYSGNPRVRPREPATASEKLDSSTKKGRISVLDRMGANRTTKIVIIVFLSIYGTMETLFYANAAYRYFSKENSE